MRLVLFLIRLVGLALARLLSPVTDALDRLVNAEGRDSFRDHARRRSIAYRVYEPEAGDNPAPVVIFSHGLGGSRDAAPYLGRALAAAGYWGIFLQHPGTDRSVMKSAGSRDEAIQRLRQAAMDPTNMRDRYLDLPFVLDRLAELNTPRGRFRGRLDLARVGMAGHSYGARSALVAAGQRLAGAGLAFREPRIRAAVLLSPAGTRRPGAAETLLPASDFAAIGIPLLHVTGTRDGSAMPGTPPGAVEAEAKTRTAPYRMIRAPEQYLLVFDGARHSDFSGTGRNESPPDSRYTRATALAAVLFFDACLKGSEAARTALRQEFPAQLEPGDRFEFK